MNVLKPAKPQTDVERWVSKLTDLRRLCGENEQATTIAQDALRDALMAGGDDIPASEKVQRLEVKGRGLQAAITEADTRLAEAREAEKAARLEQAKAAEQILLEDVKAGCIEFARAVNDLQLKSLAWQTGIKAYQANLSGLELADRSRVYGSPDMALQLIVGYAHDLEVVLGPDGYKATGLPRYTDIGLEKKS